MLNRPGWIDIPDDQRKQLRFVWDDTRAMLDFAADPSATLQGAMQMSLRARMVLCTGLYEWIVWRFDGLHARPEPLQIAQVAWCAAAEPRYMKFFELTRDEWLGTVEGPLWCAAAWLQPAMSQGHLYPRLVYEALSFLTRLALHTLPDPDRFRAWLAFALDRLVHVSPPMPDDPLQDLFDRRVGDRLGPLIGRDALDPARPATVAGAPFFTHVLAQARDERNPFLASPGDLKDAGFIGEPYVLPAPR